MSRVAVIGQVVIDEIHFESLAPPSAGSKPRVGGKAFNIAAAAARLGAEVELVTAVGDDAQGREALAAMDQAGIRKTFVVHASVGRSGRAVLTPRLRRMPIVGRALHRSDADGLVSTPRVRLTEGRYGEREVDLDQDERINEYYRTALTSFDPTGFELVIYTLEFGDSLLADISKSLRPAEAVIAGNPAPRRSDARPSPAMFELLHLADVLVPNRYEVEFLTGERPEGLPRPAPEAAQRVSEIYGSNWSVVTYGADGWAWWSDRPRSSGTSRLESLGLVDKVGASDVFTAWLCLMKLWGADIELASTTAGAAARLAVAGGGGEQRWEGFPSAGEVADSLALMEGVVPARAVPLLRGRSGSNSAGAV